jgi:hypothetical protein
MENYKNMYLLVVTFIVVVFMLDKCSSRSMDSYVNKDVEVVSTKIIVDSVRTHYEQHLDSTLIWVHHSYTEVPEKEQNDVIEPSSSFVHESSSDDRMDLSDTSELSKDINIFYYGKTDSSLNYTIRVHSSVKPSRIEMDYNVLKVLVKDSTYIRDSINTKQIDKVRMSQLYYGIEAIVYPGIKGMFAGIDFVSKEGWQLEVSAGIVGADNNLGIMGKVGIKRLLTFRKK